MLGRRWKLDALSLRGLLVFLACSASLLTLFLWHLGSGTPGLSSAEVTARDSSSSFSDIRHDPVNAPQRLLQYVVQATNHHSAFWLRLPSAVWAIIFLIVFYLMARNWFGRTTAALTTAILASTPWFILAARSATATIMSCAPLMLLASYSALVRAKSTNFRSRWLLLVLCVAVFLYVPGMIWLALAGAAFNYRTLLLTARKLGGTTLGLSGLLFVLIILPLVVSSVQSPEVIKTLALWPHSWLSLVDGLKSVGWMGLALVWQAPRHVDLIIGRLPILDVTQVVLVVFGFYVLWTKARRQLLGLLAIVVFGVVAAGINQDVLRLGLTLPALSLVIAAGLRFLYLEWRTVFPVNPIPKALAILLMVTLVGLHVVYGVRYALVAWPHATATKQVYMLK